jgi:hypothetical protein
MAASLKNKRVSITMVRDQYLKFATFQSPLFFLSFIFKIEINNKNVQYWSCLENIDVENRKGKGLELK